MIVDLYLGDCLEVMKSIPDKSIDAVITDPPYELGFMGKTWDNTGIAYRVELWLEVCRVLKPGGHLLSFGGTRTYHRMACAIEDAGFEIRDQIQWIYGSGFPKSLDISKAIEAYGKTGKCSPLAQRITAMGNDYVPSPLAGTPGYGTTGNFVNKNTNSKEMEITTPEAQQWDGWGTALKPANEPIVLARKPLSEPTVAKNVLRWGTGGLNIDGCRVGNEEHTVHGKEPGKFQPTGGETIKDYHSVSGRFPANVIHDGSDEVVALFPDSVTRFIENPCMCDEDANTWGGTFQRNRGARGYDGNGSAARFFYCAKASKSERDAGLDDVQEKEIVTFATCNGTSGKALSISEGRNTAYRNNHPTVKPIKLMQYLCKLVTPTGGVILDPFLGSGTTGRAAILEGFNFIGIERETEYMAIAEKRIKDAQQQMRLPI